MHLAGDLGLSSLVLVFSLIVPLIGFFLHRKWRLERARGEEIRRLLHLASEEATRAELEASLGYGTDSFSPNYQHCAVCYSPTTTRCARCKAVRYCSTKCQIVHWRQGHKEECKPPAWRTDHYSDEGSCSSAVVPEVDQFGINGYKCEFEQKARAAEALSTNPKSTDATNTNEDLCDKNDYNKVEASPGREGTNYACKSSSSSFSASSTGTSIELSDDISVCDSISSNESEQLNIPFSADADIDLPLAASTVNGVDQDNPLSPKFVSLVESVDKFSSLSKLNQGRLYVSAENRGALKSFSDVENRSNSKDLVGKPFIPSSGFWTETVDSVDATNDDTKLAQSNSKGGSKSVGSDSGPSLHFSFILSSTVPPPSYEEQIELKGIKSDAAFSSAFESTKPTTGGLISENTSQDVLKVGNSKSTNYGKSDDTEDISINTQQPPECGEVNSSHSHHGYPSGSEGNSTSKDAPLISCLSSSSETSGHVKNGADRTFNLLKSSKEPRCLSSISENNLSSTATLQSVPIMQTSKVDVLHANVMSPQAANGSSSSGHGSKTSMWKAVDQFRGPKLSKQYAGGVGSEAVDQYGDKVIFPYELFVKLYNWNKMELKPCGLKNCGNSCYANAVLQCLAFTPPLTSYFLQGLHSKACLEKKWCFTCEFEKLILKAKEGKSPLSPVGILSQLQNTGSQLGNGKEEDAHEFLRYAVDTMQSVCLAQAGVKTSDSLQEETTLIGLTFGGYLRSKIKCMKCQGKSERHERMMDLTVEIEGDIGTLEDALHRFTSTEILDGDNKYQCGRCKTYEKAKKKLKILEAPNILTVALKRFQSGKFGKLNKPICFPEILDLAPYVSGTSDKSPIYRLYGVVVHLDIMNAAFSGHYVCYVKNIQNKWFKADDCTVTPTELDRVLTKGAYLLLYARCSPRSPRLIRNRIVSPEVKNRAIPTRFNGRNTSSKSNSFAQTNGAQFHPSSIPPDVPTSIESFYSGFHRLQKIFEEDSSSDSSSLISSNSDEGSSSTDSTRESTSPDEFSDFIFGDASRGGRNFSDSDTSSSSSSSPLYSSRSRRVDMVAEAKVRSPFFHSDTTEQIRKLDSNSSSSSSSSRRETDPTRLGQSNLSENVSRRSSRERRD